MAQYIAVVGKIIHSTSCSKLELFEPGIVCFENVDSGRIVLLESLESTERFLKMPAFGTSGRVDSFASEATTIEERDDASLASSFSSAASLYSMSRAASSNGLLSVSGVEDLDTRQRAYALLNTKLQLQPSNVQLIMLNDKSFLIPGFVDTHFHAPQYAFTGTGYDLPLLGWLTKYTFPCEAKFEDTKFAEKVYSKVVRRLLENGTTTCSYYATIHLEATKVLAREVHRQGQRALVGKVNMDQNAPDFYIEETGRSLSDTRAFCEFVQQELGSPRVQPVITPRFAPTCSRELMTGLGDIMKEFSVPMQTHISENPDEIAWVQALFPESSSYANVYERMGLLDGENAILAHGVHLTEADHSIISRCKAGLCHCPQSNVCLMSGFLHTEKLLSQGVKVGLGTDASGGYAYSMLDAMRSAIATSKVVRVNKREAGEDAPALTLANALWLATLGGAQVLSMQESTGNFAVGKSFDALIVSLDAAEPGDAELEGVVGEAAGWSEHGVDVFDEIEGSCSAESLLEKFVYLGDSRNIRSVFVDSRCVLKK